VFEAAIAHGIGGPVANREDFQAAQFTMALVVSNGAYRIAARHQKRGPRSGAEIGVGQKLEIEQRRCDDVMSACAQRHCSAL
jgi:hypothetical protein